MKKAIIFLLLGSVAVSCTTIHNGTISSSPVDNKVKYHDIAIGVSQCSHVLGLGSKSKDALIYEAKKELFKNFPIDSNEFYLNYTLDFKSSYFIIFSTTKVTLTADIASYTADTSTTSFSENFTQRIGEEQNFSTLFYPGDSIIYNKDKRAILLSFETANTVKILCKNNKGKEYTTNISRYKIYTDKKSFQAYKAGDFFAYEYETSGKIESRVGRIVAVGEKSFLIQDTYRKKITEMRYK